MCVKVPLQLYSDEPLGSAVQPVTVGLPFPRGKVHDASTLHLTDESGRHLACQTEVLARWSDNSIKWLLVDFLLDASFAGITNCRLTLKTADSETAPDTHTTRTTCSNDVETGAARFSIDEGLRLATTVRLDSSSWRDGPKIRAVLHDAKRQTLFPSEDDACRIESEGPVRTTLLYEGRFSSSPTLVVRARFCFFEGTGLVRMRMTVQNPRRAEHRGGLWDLGDGGSLLFDQLALEWTSDKEADWLLWKSEVDMPMTPMSVGRLHMRQESSGGENWQSRNHVNRDGHVPCRFRGYRVETADGPKEGLRATPVLCFQQGGVSTTVAIPEFWQQFPKSIQTDGRTVRIGLFPEGDDSHELQGGEQKTHTAWFRFAPTTSDTGEGLDWVHHPVRCQAMPDWYEECGVFDHFLPASEDPDNRLQEYLDAAVQGPNSFLAKRETIDEFGWRHYGDCYADHENAYYEGPHPVISHYNNQFDIVYGAMVQQMRTGRPAWAEVFEPLARHVVDIDIYHTHEDRSAYNGGLFWITDHYVSAETSTHRTYSSKNRPSDGGSYGGGPGNEHNYTTGLLHSYYLTGDRETLSAIVSLADWVVAMDDGRQAMIGLMDSGPTGIASGSYSPDYHGPGRGAGNSIHALLDGYLATGRGDYLEMAERLIRRTIHPSDDVDARDLLHVEAHWSYTIYLSVLARYLEMKIEWGQLDRMYAYGRAALLRYAQWMLEHEQPYFDRPEQLEYPTEAWAAQEFRKANALRLAARYADEPLRSKFIERGEAFADRAWNDLLGFETRYTTRTFAVLLIEGMRDAWWRVKSDAPAPQPLASYDFGEPETFISQRARVRARLKTFSGLAQALLRVANPTNWPWIVRHLRRVRN